MFSLLFLCGTSEARHTAVILVIRWSYPNPCWWHCAPMTWEGEGRKGWFLECENNQENLRCFLKNTFHVLFSTGQLGSFSFTPFFVVMWSVGGSCGRRTRREIWMLILLWWCLLPQFCDVGCLSYWQSADFCTSSAPKTKTCFAGKWLNNFRIQWSILLLNSVGSLGSL